jgi:hypothetical protein
MLSTSAPRAALPAATLPVCGSFGQQEERKVFFFEKKNQKTFIN